MPLILSNGLEILQTTIPTVKHHALWGKMSGESGSESGHFWLSYRLGDYRDDNHMESDCRHRSTSGLSD